jgi:membrane protease YdiL (CAAX protease family)
LNLEEHPVLLHLLLFFFASLITAANAFFAKRWGFFTIPPHYRVSPFPLSFLNVLGAFIMFLTIQLFVAPLLVGFLMLSELGHFTQAKAFDLPTWEEGWINLLTILLTFFGLSIFYLFLNEKQKQMIWNRGDRVASPMWRNLLFGSFTWFFSYPFMIAVGQFVAALVAIKFPEVQIDQVVVKHLKNIALYPGLFWSMVATIVVIVPIIEEFMFRGLLQNWLVNKLGRLKGIGLTSLIFSLFHFSSAQGVSNFELIASLFVLSCFLGFIYERQRSLWAPIGLHATFNMISIGLIFLTQIKSSTAS